MNIVRDLGIIQGGRGDAERRRSVGFISAFAITATLSGVAIANVSFAFPRHTLVLIAPFLLLATLLYALTGSELRIVLLALVLRATLDSSSTYELAVGLNVPSLVGVAVLAICVFLLLTKRKAQVLFQIRSLPYFSLAVCGALASIRYPHVGGETLNWFTEIARMFSNVAILWMILAFVRTSDDIRRVAGAIIWSSIVPVLVGLASLLTGYRTIAIVGVPGLHRIQSLFAHANNYGHYLLIVFFVTLFYESLLDKGTARILVRVWQGALLVSLILTFSRSAMIGFVIGYVLFMARDRRRFLTSLLIVAVLGFALTRLFPGFVNYTLGETLVSDDTSVSTLASRNAIRQTGLNLLGDGWLTGLGPGSFMESVHWAAHNDYVRVLVEYGVFGLLSFLMAALIQLRDGWRLLYGVGAPFVQGQGSHVPPFTPSTSQVLAQASMSLNAAILGLSWAANIFNAPVLQWYLFALWGLVVVYRENSGC